MTGLRTLFAALCLPLSAAAGDFDVVRGDLLPGWRDGAVHHSGLMLRLRPGWKTYWRSPGDAGIPPSFDWTGSRNLSSVEVLFPTPEIFDQQGMRSLGYDGDVTFPIRVAPVDPSAPVVLTGIVDLGVCEDICIPVQLEVRAVLPAGGSTDQRVIAALRSLPMSEAVAGVAGVACRFDPIADGLRLSADVQVPELGTSEIAAVETDLPGVWVSEPRVSRSGGRLSLSADLVPPAAEPFFLARDAVRITVFGGGQAVDIKGCG